MKWNYIDIVFQLEFAKHEECQKDKRPENKCMITCLHDHFIK